MLPSIINNRYRVIRTIDHGGMGEVYYAEDMLDNNHPYAIKIGNRKTAKEFEFLLQYKNEAAALSRISHPGIVKTREIVEWNDTVVIVMEYVDGVPLSRWMADRRGGADAPGGLVDTAVEIMRQTASALAAIHDAGILHRDIKPSNMLVVEQGAGAIVVKLADFDLALQWRIATVMEKDVSQSAHDTLVGGTFQYMPPEQFNRSGAVFDERSDLYSLGMIFYELVSGRPPFIENDIAAMITAHLSKVPERPAVYNPAVPPVLESMLIKLLEKNPDRRYQSARGLLFDLDKYQSGMRDFVPGSDDLYARVCSYSSFIGREDELRRLEECHEGAAHGRGYIFLVSGESGIGKTTLVNEFRNRTYKTGMLFLQGKCAAFEDKSPFALFSGIMDSYLKHYSMYTDEKKKKIRKDIQKATGASSALLMKFHPDLKDFFEMREQGSPFTVQEKEREQKRFLMALAGFFLQLSKVEEGMVLFLDDIQWADEDSLRLLNIIAQEIAQYPLLIIGTYRDTEITPLHPLTWLLISAKEHGYPVNHARLSAFSKDMMTAYVSNLFYNNYSDESMIMLAEFMGDKSGGNPLIIRELLRQFYEERIIYYDANNKIKVNNIDLRALYRLTLPSTVVGILHNRLSYLDEQGRLVLSFAAVIGASFTIDLLRNIVAEVAADDLVEVESVIPSVKKAMVLQIAIEDAAAGGRYTFTHDSLREALYNKLSPAEKTMIHRSIAHNMEQSYMIPDNPDAERLLFDMARHFIEGKVNEKAFGYAYRAGLKAYENNALESAVYFLSAALTYHNNNLGNSGQGAELRRATLDINIILCDIYIVIGRYDEAIAGLTAIIPQSNSDEEKAYYYKQICLAYYKKGDWAHCEEFAQKGLAMLGEPLPLARSTVVIDAVFELVVHMVHLLVPNIFFSGIRRRRGKVTKVIIGYYYALCIMYSLSDHVKFVRTVLRMYNIAQRRIGTSRELGLSMGYYGLLLMSVGLYRRSLVCNLKALRMKKDLFDEWGVAQSLQFIGICNYFKLDYPYARRYLDESVDLFERIGDIGEAQTGLSLKISILVFSSDVPAAIAAIEHYENYGKKTGDEYNACFALIFRAQLLVIQGDYAMARELMLRGEARSFANEFWFLNCFAHIMLGELCMETGEYQDILVHATAAQRLIEERHFTKEFVANFYLLEPRALIVRLETAKGRGAVLDRPAILKKLKRACRRALRHSKGHACHGGACLTAALGYALNHNYNRAEYYCLTRGEKPSTLVEDFSKLAVWKATVNQVTPYMISSII